ncbi:phage head-tail adapter protein, partial [Enterococcus hirae]
LSLSDRREMTAREVQERHEEKLLMLGPVIERVQNELLDPMIDRVFSIALRGNALPPPPEELEGVDLRVEYISILAQAQRM